MDVLSHFKTKLGEMRREDNARYFLMRVEKVQISQQDSNVFRAFGSRIDNGQMVALTSKKASSGQFIPEVGGVLRADKVTRLAPNPANPTVGVYKADYFHAYAKDELCLSTTIQATRPRKNPSNGMINANVYAFDLETNVETLPASSLVSGIDDQLLQMLKPWEAKQSSAITHDVKGSPIWGDGTKAKSGLSPFVVLRFGDSALRIWGQGYSKVGKEDSLPTDEELRNRLATSKELIHLKSIAAGIPQVELAKHQLFLIPGLAIQVGRESLADDGKVYMRLPEAYEWKNMDRLGEDGKPTVSPGYRPGFVHIKESRKGAMMVVNAVPSPAGRLTKDLPLSELEKTVAMSASAGAENAQKVAETKRETARPQQSKTTDQVAQQRSRNPEPQSEQAPRPAQNSFDDPSDVDDDFSLYADDLAAMELMNTTAHFAEPADDIQNLLEEAEARTAQRRSRPSM